MVLCSGSLCLAHWSYQEQTRQSCPHSLSRHLGAPTAIFFVTVLPGCIVTTVSSQFCVSPQFAVKPTDTAAFAQRVVMSYYHAVPTPRLLGNRVSMRYPCHFALSC